MNTACSLLIVEPDDPHAWHSLLPDQPAVSLPTRAVLNKAGIPAHCRVVHLGISAARLRTALADLVELPNWRLRAYCSDDGSIHAVLEKQRFGGGDEAALLTAQAALTTRISDLGRPHAKTIMLVEDEDVVRALCRRVLQDHYFVLEAASPHAALLGAEWLPWPTDLVVSDVNLPAMDGVALSRKWLARTPSARVLLLSGDFLPDSARGLPALFLQKPFPTSELLQSVRVALGEKRCG